MAWSAKYTMKYIQDEHRTATVVTLDVRFVTKTPIKSTVTHLTLFTVRAYMQEFFRF